MKINAFHLKIIALITMIIDHLGMMFFEKHFIFRIVGRIAFIIYAFMLVEGCFHTKNFKKYVSKLLLWGFISEVPFDLAKFGNLFELDNQNIFFTLFLSAIGIHFLEKNKNTGLRILICLIISFLALILKVDYSMYGTSIILAFYFAKNLKIRYITSISLLIFLAGLLDTIQLFAVLGLIPISMYNGKQGIKTGNIYYSFYALHLGFFVIIKHFYVSP